MQTLTTRIQTLRTQAEELYASGHTPIADECLAAVKRLERQKETKTMTYTYTYDGETIGTGETALDAAIDAQDTIEARELPISVEDCELEPASESEPEPEFDD